MIASAPRPMDAADKLCLPLEIKAEDGDTAPGSFEGYGSVFGNRDRDGDIVAPGAFTDSLKSRLPALLWQHDQKAPIGTFDEVREDARGLYVKGRLAMSGRGKEAYDLLKMGALNGLSIGFVSKEASRDPATGVRNIHKADLMEVSLVTFPANELARVADVKSGFDMDDGTINGARSFERLLRNNGFSRSRAKAITAKGFKAADFGADDSAEIAELVAELKARQGAFEGKSKKALMELAGSVLSGIASSFATDQLNQLQGRKDFEDGVKVLVDYLRRARRGKEKHVFSLSKGASKTVIFPVNHSNSQRKLFVTASNPGKHRFAVELSYAKWSDRSVQARRGKIFDSAKFDGIIDTPVDVGGLEKIGQWLAEITPGKVRQAKSALGREVFPRARITYIGPVGDSSSQNRGRETPVRFLASFI